MNVRSTAPDAKFRNISNGTEYTVLRETSDFYYVNNDAGAEQRYGKGNFEVVVIPEPVVIHPPLEIVTNREGDTFNIRITRGEAEQSTSIHISRISGNCGVDEFEGVNQIQSCVQFVLDNSPAPAEGDRDINAIVLDIFTRAVASSDGGICAFSTNDDAPVVVSALDAIIRSIDGASKCGPVVNPNSGNPICVWLMPTGLEPEEDDDEYENE